MEFFEHTVHWIKGENFEGGMIALWGVMMIVLAVYFLIFGHSEITRVLIIPFVMYTLWLECKI